MIASRANPRVKRWAKLARDSRLRRSEGRALIEGPHLVAEAFRAGLRPVAVLASESGLRRAEIQALTQGRPAIVLSEGAFKAVVEAETPPGIAAEIELPVAPARIDAPAVFLESVQDPGNVGAILRSAAAFGVRSAVLDRACADAWSPKALRAGMGAHFSLSLYDVPRLSEAMAKFDGTILCTVPRGGVSLERLDLDGTIGWIFGGEGGGVTEASARHAAHKVSIPMARDTESLNVAAAAAVCLYQAFSRRAARS